MKKQITVNELDFLVPLPLAEKIRLGPKRDGGYVVYRPSLLKTDILMTYGVGWDFDFEVDFHNLTDKKVYMYDPTMFGDGYFNKVLIKSLFKRLKFKKLYAYLKYSYRWKRKIEYLRDHNVIFFSEGIALEKEGKYDTFVNHLIKNNITTETLLLKMDIEENEYAIFNDPAIFDHLYNVDQIVIEFHNLKNRLREFKKIVLRLKESYEIVHIHANNNSALFTLYNDNGNDMRFPDIVEVTFVKKESIMPDDILSEKITYPCPDLDYPNIPSRPDYIWNLTIK